MSARKGEITDAKPKITVDDLKRKAEFAVDIAKAEIDDVVHADASKYVAVLAVVFLAGVSIAYLAGATSRRR